LGATAFVLEFDYDDFFDFLSSSLATDDLRLSKFNYFCFSTLPLPLLPLSNFSRSMSLLPIFDMTPNCKVNADR
jgi:hypothetical protein